MARRNSSRVMPAMLLAAVGVVQGSCGAAGTDKSQQVGNGSMPSAVRQISEAQLPSMNAFQVEKRGSIAVRPNSLFCSVAPSVSPDLEKRGLTGVGPIGITDHLERLGQSGSLDGSGRQRVFDPVNCADDGRNVLIRAEARPNRAGAPYVVVLAAWQGSAYWVGGIERDRKRPDSTVPEKPPAFGDAPCCEPLVSIRLDMKSLTDKLMADVTEGHGD